RGMSGKPGPLTTSAARAPPNIPAAGGGRDPSARTGSAGISIRVLMASPHHLDERHAEGKVRAGKAAPPVNGINEPGTSSQAAGLPPMPPGRRLRDLGRSA